MTDTTAARDRAGGPLLVFGPRSLTYDFGAGHPLTPRRFGPGIDLLHAVGAEPGLAPEPASDDDLRLAHSAAYLETVRRFSADPHRLPAAGIGPGDTPAFAGMQDAAATVAGGSLRAVEAILRGDVLHAHHPGGGLHHAMPDRASGFCVYDDVGLAIALARRRGARVMYVDLDVHHGDGVQAMHGADPGVLTVSVHQSGRTIFPGTGFVDELGSGRAAGTSVNVPLEAWTGDEPWLAAVHRLVPALAAAFGPDLVVTQHGADAHAFDPLGSLLVTTGAMSDAARLIDRVAHRWAGGRWLATGGGGYDIYRAVPRVWALTWLAGAHRAPPSAIPGQWRERWADDARRAGQSPLPAGFIDPPNAGFPFTEHQADGEARSRAVADLVAQLVVPALLRAAETEGWWRADDGRAHAAARAAADDRHDRSASDAGTASIVPVVDGPTWAGLELEPRVLSPLDTSAAHGLVLGALTSGRSPIVTAAVAGTQVVGIVVSSPPDDGARRLLAVGVAPAHRRHGLATALLRAHVADLGDVRLEALVTVAERDVIDPLPGDLRQAIARRLLVAAGLQLVEPPTAVGAADRTAVFGVRGR